MIVDDNYILMIFTYDDIDDSAGMIIIPVENRDEIGAG